MRALRITLSLLNCKLIVSLCDLNAVEKAAVQRSSRPVLRGCAVAVFRVWGVFPVAILGLPVCAWLIQFQGPLLSFMRSLLHTQFPPRPVR